MKRAAPSEHLLAYRLRQQSLLSDFGLFALRCRDLDALLQRATELCAEGMNARFAKVLEYRAASDRLLVRAGIGWEPGIVGSATIGADLESPAGYALKTGAAVISNHLTQESRFRTPQLLAEHGIKRAINVIIRSSERDDPFGVLEVDSTSSGQFDEADLAFMQGFANLLGVAIERQRLEAARGESEEQVRLIVEGVQDYAIFTLDPEGRIATWNAGAQAVFGWEAGEIVGRDFAVTFTPEDRAAGVPREELRIAREGGCAPDERWHLRKDGSRFWVDGSTRPLHDASGQLRGYIKVGHDNTERRRTINALSASEARYRAIIDTAVDAIVVIDAGGIVQSFNPAAERIFGYAAHEVVGRNVSLLMPGGHAQRHDGYIEAYRRTGQARIIGSGREVQGRRKDGSVFPLDLSIAEWRTNEGTFFTGIMRDVTQRKQAEEANARLAAIVSLSSDAIISFAPEDGRILTWNKGAEALFGYTEAEAVGAPASLLLPPEQPEGPTGVFAHALEKGRFAVETVRVTKSGERIDVAITATRMTAPDGRVLGVSAIFRDIREHRRAERLMRDAMEHQETLIREVSHRVKNSLALVASLLAMQARAAGDDEVRRALRDAEARVGTIAEVHDQLWRRGDITVVDLVEFLRGLCVKLQETAPQHRLVFEADAEVMVPTDRAVPTGLLVTELVTNAFKYAYSDAGGEVRVRVGRVEAGRLQLVVSDRGRGLPPGFSLAKPNGSLGTRLIGGFVRQLEAEIRVVDAAPGTAFLVDIPQSG